MPDKMICPHCDKDIADPVKMCEMGSSDVGVFVPCSLKDDHGGPCIAGPGDTVVGDGGRCDGRAL